MRGRKGSCEMQVTHQLRRGYSELVLIADHFGQTVIEPRPPSRLHGAIGRSWTHAAPMPR